MSAYHNTTPCGDWSGCTRCRLHITRRTVITRRSGLIKHGVITHGAYYTNPQTYSLSSPTLPHVLFIGEAPGELEDMLGLAFWGPAGNILDRILIECSNAHPGHKHIPSCIHKLTDLQTTNSATEACPSCQLRTRYGPTNFYFTITNTVCCRPVHTVDTTPTIKLHGRNRQPTEAEINSCKNHILELIQLSTPHSSVPAHSVPFPITHVVCLGEVANKAYGTLGVPHPALHLLHPAFIARMDYQHLPIIKQAESLRTWIRQKH